MAGAAPRLTSEMPESAARALLSSAGSSAAAQRSASSSCPQRHQSVFFDSVFAGVLARAATTDGRCERCRYAASVTSMDARSRVWHRPRCIGAAMRSCAGTTQPLMRLTDAIGTITSTGRESNQAELVWLSSHSRLFAFWAVASARCLPQSGHRHVVGHATLRALIGASFACRSPSESAIKRT